MMSYYGSVSSSNFVPPLDRGITSVGAYSVRKLRSAYNGFAINLRRSNDNATTDVSFDSQLVISGSSIVSAGGDLATWAGANTLFVTTLYDQSGFGFNLSQATAGSQLQFILNVISINNKPTLRNTGGNRNIFGAGSSLFNAPHNNSIFLVYGQNIASTNIFQIVDQTSGLMLLRAGSLSSFRLAIRYYNTSNALALQSSSGSGVTTSYNQEGWVATNSALLTTTTYQNTNKLATDTSAGAWSNTSVVTPRYLLGTGSGFSGDVSELIIFSDALTISEAQSINISQKNYFHTT